MMICPWCIALVCLIIEEMNFDNLDYVSFSSIKKTFSEMQLKSIW